MTRERDVWDVTWPRVPGLEEAGFEVTEMNPQTALLCSRTVISITSQPAEKREEWACKTAALEQMLDKELGSAAHTHICALHAAIFHTTEFATIATAARPVTYTATPMLLWDKLLQF